MLIKDLPYGTYYSMMRLWLATSRCITAEETDVIGDLLTAWQRVLPGYNLLMQTLLRRHIALPQDHGSWVFLFSPLLIGLFAAGCCGVSGNTFSPASLAVVVGAVAAFLIRLRVRSRPPLASAS